MFRKRMFQLLMVIVVVLGGSLYLKNCGRKKEAPDQSRVDEIFSEWNRPDTPGAAVAVIRDGAVVFRKDYGMAGLEYGIPITPETVFHTASVSKQFTAFAAALLAEEGRISLDADIHRYLPELPEFGSVITVRHLLHHTSGLRDQLELAKMAGFRLDDVISQEYILNLIYNQRALNFISGSEYMYCNTGYTLLAEIVARVTGESFSDWTRENIFDPLGMEKTRFRDDPGQVVMNSARSYEPDESGEYKRKVLSYSNFGATGLLTTVDDMVKWLLNLENGRVGGPEVRALMQERGALNDGRTISYAFGLEVGEYRGLKTVGHDGYDAGFRSAVLWFPEQRFGVVMLSNNGAVDPGKTVRRIADLYLSREYTEEESPAPERRGVEVDPVFLDKYGGKYLLENDRIITVSRDGERLLFQGSGPDKLELLAESDTVFYLQGTDIKLSFELNNVGMVMRLVLHQRDQEVTGKRVAVAPFSPEQAVSYAGTYLSEELGAVYTVVYDKGRLGLRHRRNGELTLTHLVGDTFRGDQWWLRSVRFIKDEEGRVTGFAMTGDRVRNLKFDKIGLAVPRRFAESNPFQEPKA